MPTGRKNSLSNKVFPFFLSRSQTESRDSQVSSQRTPDSSPSRSPHRDDQFSSSQEESENEEIFQFAGSPVSRDSSRPEVPEEVNSPSSNLRSHRYPLEPEIIVVGRGDISPSRSDYSRHRYFSPDASNRDASSSQATTRSQRDPLASSSQATTRSQRDPLASSSQATTRSQRDPLASSSQATTRSQRDPLASSAQATTHFRRDPLASSEESSHASKASQESRPRRRETPSPTPSPSPPRRYRRSQINPPNSSENVMADSFAKILERLEALERGQFRGFHPHHLHVRYLRIDSLSSPTLSTLLPCLRLLLNPTVNNRCRLLLRRFHNLIPPLLLRVGPF